MKIQINSMKKAQEISGNQNSTRDENVDPNSEVVKPNRTFNRIESSNSKGVKGFKSRLDSLGDHVQELFSEFKSAMSQNKNPSAKNLFSWKRPSSGGKVTMSGTNCNKLMEKFEKIQNDISQEKESLTRFKRNKRSKSRKNSQSSRKNKSRRKSKSSRKNKSKSPIKAFGIKLAKRDTSHQKGVKL